MLTNKQLMHLIWMGCRVADWSANRQSIQMKIDMNQKESVKRDWGKVREREKEREMRQREKSSAFLLRLPWHAPVSHICPKCEHILHSTLFETKYHMKKYCCLCIFCGITCVCLFRVWSRFSFVLLITSDCYEVSNRKGWTCSNTIGKCTKYSNFFHRCFVSPFVFFFFLKKGLRHQTTENQSEIVLQFYSYTKMIAVDDER